MHAERVRTVKVVLRKKRESRESPGGAKSRMFHEEFHALLASTIALLQKTEIARMAQTHRLPRIYDLFQKPLTVPTRAPLTDAGIGNLDDEREGTGGFSSTALGRGAFGSGREGGIGSFDVGDIGAGLASTGACRDCDAITDTSLAGGLNLFGAWGILERTVVGEGRDVFPVIGSLESAISLVPGAFRLFGFAVNRKMDFDRAIDWLAGTRFVENIGSTPAADAKDVRLLGGGRREIRDPFGVLAGHAKETRESDTDASEMESWDALWKVVIVDAD